MKYLLTGLIAVMLFIASCGAPGDESGATDQSTTSNAEINLKIALNGIFIGSIENNEQSVQESTSIINYSASDLINLAVINYFSGQLVITNQNQLTDFLTYPVTASVNSDTLEVQLLQTIVLKPGNYMFELNISRAGQQYAGVVVAGVTSTNGGGINTINMTIKPIIGDSLISTSIVDELGNLSFKYADVPNLKDATDDIIEIGVILDSTGDEALFRFDDTGESGTYLNLASEPSKIELKLYKNGGQIGKSRSAQENQAFNFGQDINMDLIPIFGRTLIALSSDGGDATFDVEFPTEIVSGGSISLDNLDVQLTFNGILNSTQTQNIVGTDFILDTTNDLYTDGSFLFSGVQYDNISVYLTYTSIDTGDLIGACNFQINLNSTTQHSALCSISIQNSIAQSGSMMALANISVYNPALTPGASVYVIKDGGEEQILGITNTTGYIESYLKAGTYKIGARIPANGRFGELDGVELDTISVENIAITLDASAPINASALINGGNNATYSKYVTLNLAAHDDDSITHYYASEDNTVPDPFDLNWLTINDPTSDYQGNYPFILSTGDGSKTAYVWYKNPDNKISQVAQDSIVLQKDSGVYLSNFSVTSSTYPDNSDINLACQTENNANYRLADWNDLAAYIGSSQANALAISNLIGLPADGDTYTGVTNKRFVSYNGSRWEDSQSTKQYYIARLDANETIGSGIFTSTMNNLYDWGQPKKSITANHDLLLVPETTKTVTITVPIFGTRTVASVDEIQNLSARVVCFDESGYHPLLNGSFDDANGNFQYWGFVSGGYIVSGGELVLENEIANSSIVNQENIGVVDNASYRLSADIKSATIDTTITIEIQDNEGDILAEIQTTSNTWSTEFADFTVDVAGGDVLPLTVIVSIPANSTGNGLARNISLIYQ